MLVGNLVKLIGLVGFCLGIEIIAGLIAIFLAIYIQNQYLAGVAGGLSSISMSGALIYLFLKREPH
jgi:hypothetical protein